MAPDTTKLTRKQVAAEQLADWEWLVGVIEARYETGGFATGLELANRIGAAAEEADHHPDLTLTWPLVHVRLVSHDAGGVTSRDVAMARRISEIAAELGVTPTPGKLTKLEFGLDVADIPAAARFWAAVLGYDVDETRPWSTPTGARSELWFQENDAHEEPRQRSTSTSRCRPTRRRPGSTPPSPPAAPWSAPTGRRRGPCSPTLRATRPASAPGRAGAGLMEPRVSFITLAVPDLEAAYAFYVDGLGWEPAMHVPGRRADDPGRRQAAAVAVGRAGLRGRGRPDPPRRRPRPDHAGPQPAHPRGGRRRARAARAAGASYVGEAAEREWGGYTGYFGDPAGFRWEVAYNPGPIGQTVLP